MADDKADVDVTEEKKSSAGSESGSKADDSDFPEQTLFESYTDKDSLKSNSKLLGEVVAYRANNKNESYVTHVVREARIRAYRDVENSKKDEGAFTLSDQVWNPLLKELKDTFAVQDMRPFADHSFATDIYEMSVAPGSTEASKTRRKMQASGQLLDESVLVASVVRYWLLDNTQRKSYSMVYFALKHHLKSFHPATYEELQNIMKLNQETFFHQFFGDTTNYVQAILADMKTAILSSLQEGPRANAIAMMLASKGNLKALAVAGGSFFVVSATMVILGLVAISELLSNPEDTPKVAAHRQELNDTMAYMLQDLDNMVKKSSYRFPTVTNIFARIFEGIGVKSTALFVERLRSAKLPSLVDIENNLATVSVLAAMREVEGKMFSSEGSRKEEIQRRANRVLDQLNAVLRRGNREETTRFLTELFKPFEENRARMRQDSKFSMLAGLLQRSGT